MNQNNIALFGEAKCIQKLKEHLPLQMTSGQWRQDYVVQENFRSDIPFLLLAQIPE